MRNAILVLIAILLVGFVVMKHYNNRLPPSVSWEIGERVDIVGDVSFDGPRFEQLPEGASQGYDYTVTGWGKKLPAVWVVGTDAKPQILNQIEKSGKAITCRVIGTVMPGGNKTTYLQIESAQKVK